MIGNAIAKGVKVKLVGVHDHALSELQQLGIIERVGITNRLESIADLR